jgi:hypothetical protein
VSVVYIFDEGGVVRSLPALETGGGNGVERRGGARKSKKARKGGGCEKRVRGQSGAKFKKTTSSENELEVLKSWGLDTHTSIKE